MNSNYSFLLHRTEEFGKYGLDVLPFPLPNEFKLGMNCASFNSAHVFFDATEAIWTMFSVDDQDNRIPQSEINFWYVDVNRNLYGQFLFTGEKVKGKIEGILPTKDGKPVRLDLMIGEGLLFDDPSTDQLVSKQEARGWQDARRYKRLKTQEISLYNNHGFYRIEYSAQ